MHRPFEVLPAENGRWGEVHDHIIHDALTQAEWELEEFGPLTAFRHRKALQELVEAKIWRSAAAADLLVRIERMLAGEINVNARTNKTTLGSVIEE